MSWLPNRWTAHAVYSNEDFHSLLTILVQQVKPVMVQGTRSNIEQVIKEINHRELKYTTHSNVIVKTVVDEGVLPAGHVITEKAMHDEEKPGSLTIWQIQDCLSFVSGHLVVFESKKIKAQRDDGRFVLVFSNLFPDDTTRLAGVVYADHRKDHYSYYGDMLIYQRMLILAKSKVLPCLKAGVYSPTTWGAFKEACIIDGILKDTEELNMYCDAFRDDDQIWFEHLDRNLFQIQAKDTWRKQYAKPHERPLSMSELASLSAKQAVRLLTSKSYMYGYLFDDGIYAKTFDISALYGDYA